MASSRYHPDTTIEYECLRSNPLVKADRNLRPTKIIGNLRFTKIVGGLGPNNIVGNLGFIKIVKDLRFLNSSRPTRS
jgi:hypothetical protein